VAPRLIGALVLCAVGGVWILQGVGVLPGSFMTGRGEYAVLGSIVLLAGLALLAWTYRNRPDDS